MTELMPMATHGITRKGEFEFTLTTSVVFFSHDNPPPHLWNLSFSLPSGLNLWFKIFIPHKPFNRRNTHEKRDENASGCLFLSWKISVPFNFLFSGCNLNDFMIGTFFLLLTMNALLETISQFISITEFSKFLTFKLIS